MNIDQAQDRYNNDAPFNQLVKVLYHMMYEVRFTHEDLRNAAFLAAVMIEKNRTAPYLMQLRENDSEFESRPL